MDDASLDFPDISSTDISYLFSDSATGFNHSDDFEGCDDSGGEGTGTK